MTKQELFDAFNGEISKKAIQRIDDEYRIVGKYCYVAPQDDGFDIFICNTRNIAAGLGQKAVRNRMRAIFSSAVNAVTEVDGEAWGKVQDRDVILRNLKLLGIRKKRENSVSNLQQSKEIHD